MKKLNVLLIISMLAVILLAANPAGKLVRLEVINASGDTVYLKLEGKHTEAFYYLTIADGDDTTFTVLVDDYKRTTWACNGIKSSGSLVMSGNVRLKFVQCGTLPLRVAWGGDLNLNGVPDDSDNWLFDEVWLAPNFGEPTQEKVVYFEYYSNIVWTKRCGSGWGAADCTWFWWTGTNWESAALWIKVFVGLRWRAYRFPVGIYMRYRY